MRKVFVPETLSLDFCSGVEARRESSGGGICQISVGEICGGTDEGIPQGRPKAKALGYQPQIFRRLERPKAEALGYLEAKARALMVSRSKPKAEALGYLEAKARA